MRVLVNAHRDDDGSKAAVLVELRMEDVARLDKGGLDMGEVRVALESVDGFEF